MDLTATFKPIKWEESTSQQITATSKITRASVEYEYSGDIEGKASVEYVMFYRRFSEKDLHDAEASYVGFLKFEGSINGRKGSVVMRDEGTYHGGEARSMLEIVENSGAGELTLITGSGSYLATKDEQKLTLSVDF